MCQKLTCMFSNWLKIRPYWFMHEIVLYSSDLVVQFKSNFDLPILIFSKIILFLFYREIFQSFLLVQSTLGFDEFFLYPWISCIRLHGNDFFICYQRIICLHALMGCASWAICRHSCKYKYFELIIQLSLKYRRSLQGILYFPWTEKNLCNTGSFYSIKTSLIPQHFKNLKL